MTKIQKATINIFLLLNLYFVRNHIWKNLLCIDAFLLVFFFRVEGYWKCCYKTPTPIQICIGLVEAVLRPEIRSNRLGILTVFHFDSNEIVFLFLYGNIFGSPHTSNRIYLLRNCFSNYLYLKDMYIALKGIGKILFV